MLTIEKILENSYTMFAVAVVLGALALSGRFSVTATQLLLVMAWGIAIVGLRSQPTPILVGCGAVLAGCLILLAYWFRPEAVPTHTGTLTPQSTLLFSPDGGGTIPKIQIGQSGVFIVGEANPYGSQLFPALRHSQFRIELIDGKMKVSTQVKDSDGNLIAEIIRNEWKTSPIGTWDRNYSDDALEVKDAKGNIILQVRTLLDRIQVQGAWWIDMGPPNGVRRLIARESPEGVGAEFVIAPKDADQPAIVPMFEYPGDQHLGELRK
jgi:hypothetical protein